MVQPHSRITKIIRAMRMGSHVVQWQPAPLPYLRSTAIHFLTNKVQSDMVFTLSVCWNPFFLQGVFGIATNHFRGPIGLTLSGRESLVYLTRLVSYFKISGLTALKGLGRAPPRGIALWGN